MDNGNHRDFGRFAAFQTFREGSLRTVGTLFQPPTKWGQTEVWDGQDAQALSRMIDPQQDCRHASATGKVAIITPGLEGQTLACYQVDDRNGTTVFCGNATAAGLALLGIQEDSLKVTLKVISGQSQLMAKGWLVRHEAEVEVQHEWTIDFPFALEQVTIFDRPSVRLQWLNDYYIISGPVKANALQIASELSLKTFISRKVAIVTYIDNECFVEFHNASGVHGSAPMTGLLSLSIASQDVSWLSFPNQLESIRTPSSVETIPASSRHGTAHTFGLPTVKVRLSVGQLQI